jgi:hypothetical protein
VTACREARLVVLCKTVCCCPPESGLLAALLAARPVADLQINRRAAAAVMLLPPQLLGLGDQAAEVPCRARIARGAGSSRLAEMRPAVAFTRAATSPATLS